jgi:hypothetical protein
MVARLQLVQCLSDKRRIWPNAQTVLTPGQMVILNQVEQSAS